MRWVSAPGEGVSGKVSLIGRAGSVLAALINSFIRHARKELRASPSPGGAQPFSAPMPSPDPTRRRRETWGWLALVTLCGLLLTAALTAALWPRAVPERDAPRREVLTTAY